MMSVSPDWSKNSLNAARGHLRVLLASWLWKPVANVLRSSCACKEKTVFEYLRALTMTGGYPTDQQGRNSVSGVCRSLGSFDNHFKPTKSRHDCYVCGANWSRVVTDAVISIKKHFDGLCLDCMDHTQPKFLDEHEDYWNHVLCDKQWDKHCRIKHGQATWYSSFSEFSTSCRCRAALLIRRSGSCRYERQTVEA